jgi:hypothetical protein
MNEWKKQLIVKGVSFFDGEIDGKRIESGSVFIEEELDARNGNAKGIRTVDYKTTAAVVKKAIHNEFPCTCDVTFGMKTTKNGNTVEVRELVPVGRVPQQKAA